ncbi:MAG: hypothetical protein QOE92_68, partial [Chloroflexota bacterium]|nr:hypothetical protein [Chloroflexota bacterium]
LPPGPTGPARRDASGGLLGFFSAHREVATAIAVVLMLALIVGGALVVNRPVEAVRGEVITQPANSVGADPFTPSVATSPSPAQSITPSPPAESPNLTPVQGSSPGLYGGTQKNAACDRTKMIDFLKANPDKARAWAATEGIQVDEIPDYINSLTPVLLRYDTRVTNHGFVNGRANAYQAVLQAGTGVLVDRYGVPRARCYCGNPLTPPTPQTQPKYTGETWPAFKPGTVVVVVPPGTPVTILTLADPAGNGFGRQVGTETTDGPAPPVVQPSPLPSPAPKVNPLSGTYTLQPGGGAGNIGEWQAVPLAADACAGQVNSQTALYRYELVIVPGHIAVNFLNAKADGPIADDGSFSVKVIYTPPITTDITMNGKVDSSGNVVGSFDELIDYPPRAGCSFKFGGKKAR